MVKTNKIEVSYDQIVWILAHLLDESYEPDECAGFFGDIEAETLARLKIIKRRKTEGGKQKEVKYVIQRHSHERAKQRYKI